MAELTPMMIQYLKIHEEVPDALLFFRLGDFYEMFFDDALKASRELEIALTGRDCGLDERAPMCGVPYHAAQTYITRLVEKGYKVAICEQMEDPKEAKGIVKREIIRVISPGTISEGKLLESKKNNYLMTLYLENNCLGIASLDVSTGDFFVTEMKGKNKEQWMAQLSDELGRLLPAEVILNPELFKDSQALGLIENNFGILASLYPEKYFNVRNGGKRIIEQFDVFALGALDLERRDHAVAAAGALLGYLDATQKRALTHIKTIRYYNSKDYMVLDLSTRRNLELTQTLRTLEKRGSLLGVLDKTVTAMGGRTLRRWVEAPLLKTESIFERQGCVDAFYNNAPRLPEFKTILTKVYDLERLCGKLSFGSINPKDLLALKQSLGALPLIKDFIDTIDSEKLQQLFDNDDILEDIWDYIEKAIDDDAPMVLKDGHVIKTGFHQEIDEFREATDKGQDWIRDLECRERENTGIKNLKVKYNRIFGYFIEITKSNLSQVPEGYIRKQTLSNAERYFTPELKDMENKILGAQEGLLRCETEIFQKIREQLLKEIPRIQKKAREVAELDAIYSLATVAQQNHYVCPKIVDEKTIFIENGRHPVVEEMIGSDHFIGNDCTLNNDDQRMLIITGPNMAGKSTFIRQVAIITLMAQIGSFVPADAATIGVVDRIFTRVGASDDLASGQSTFMVEMTEVANILKNATDKSLVILDEIGRGTSTFDGISIAWAVVEYLHNEDNIGAKTLFATHYHELTELESLKPGIKNFSIRLKETPDGVIFLRKIISGPADQSYGIEVAKLAGFPTRVTQRAQEILGHLESGENTYRQELLVTEPPMLSGGKGSQLNFFDVAKSMTDEEEAALSTLRDLKMDEMSPIEVMNVIYQLREKI
ncbi:DNA mismatch repair protein MutS [Acetobacterium paludosum]|uniref:DNA mismatch repair protein MutS n=1 Tax=Acetobacterium paludosum TaxID=52693 RepID=A0A923HW72_9FIRM|nr:DNA mismatch repair protein MutS [Acetobacterium paludosum]MBC3889426.1 DNA mismatch repair protein MutS [Acetobacterium paludosum]